jgi:hypothetical protein
MGRMTTHILWNIKNVPNHQPDILLFQLLTIINHRLTRKIHVPNHQPARVFLGALCLQETSCWNLPHLAVRPPASSLIRLRAEDNLHSLSCGYILIKLAIANTRGFENSACLGNLLLNFFSPISACHDQNWSMKPTCAIKCRPILDVSIMRDSQ